VYEYKFYDTREIDAKKFMYEFFALKMQYIFMRQFIYVQSPSTDITRVRDAKGFEENKSAVRRGQIARNTRKELEDETGKSIVSDENFLEFSEKKRLGKRRK